MPRPPDASRRDCRCSEARGRNRPRAQRGCARPSVPDKAPIDTSSLISSPSNPIDPRITSRIIIADVVAGWTASMALNTTCAVMPRGSLDSGRNAAKSVSSRVARSVSTTGSFEMAVGGGASVARQVFHHRQHAGGHQAFGLCACKRRDLVRRIAEGAVADHPVGAGHRYIGHRHAIDVDPKRDQILGDQPAAEPRRLKPADAVAVHRAPHRLRPADRPANAAVPSRCTRPPS